MFSKAVMRGDTGAADAALKFVYAHREVSTVLCGVGDSPELRADVNSLSALDVCGGRRRERVSAAMGSFPDFCTGCGYCADCPAGLSLPALMTAYNQTMFRPAAFIYNRTSPKLIARGNFFRAAEGKAAFESAENPCVMCRKCESACTQRLPITDRVAEIYRWADECCASLEGHRRRVEKLIKREYGRVGFFTAGACTEYVLNLRSGLFGDSRHEVFVFDNNPLRWGCEFSNGIAIRSPDEIPALDLDIVLISNYVHSDDIYADLTARFPGENIKKLHEDGDVPWVY
jgi:ferredoxin